MFWMKLYTYRIRMVFEDPAPLRQPVMQITGSPDLINPFFFPKSTQYWIRSSTSADQSSIRGSKRKKDEPIESLTNLYQ